jgi:putative inorganic carbon (HCO3(-)) transporter
MKSLSQNIASPKSRMTSYVLMIVLPLVAVACTYLIVKTAHIPPMVYVAGVIALAVVIFSVMYPEFGFYVTIIVPYFIFDFIRLINTDAPIGTVIDVMVWVTFVGVMIKMRNNHVPFWNNCNNAIVGMYVVIQLYYLFERFNPNGGNLELFVGIVKRNLSIFLVLYCGLQLFTDIKSIRRFFYVWLILSFLNGFYACWEELIYMPKFEMNYILEDPLREMLSSLDNGNYRKSGFLSGCTDFGLSMTGTIIMTIVFYLRLKTTQWKKAFLLISTLVMTLGMIFSGTRTANFMLILEVALYVLMTINEKKTLIFGGICAFLLAFVIFVPIYGNGTINRIRTTFQLSTDESLNVRDVNRHSIQPYLQSHPIGGGLGTTGGVNYFYNIGHPLAGFPTDSGLLMISLEQGYVGLIITCTLYFMILFRCVRSFYRARNPEYKVIYLAITGFIFGFVFAQYAQVAIGQVPNGFAFAAMVAIVLRLNDLEKRESTDLDTKTKIAQA